jgi:lysyl-tRNA synthetase class 2
MSRPEHLLKERLDKLDAWHAQGVPAYPHTWPRTHTSADVRTQEAALQADPERRVAIAGRVMTQRGHGRTAFAHLQDGGGRLQVYVRRDDVGAAVFARWQLLDVGDIVGVRGPVFRTKTNELTVRVLEFALLAKALRPLPDKWHGLTDKEVRYRQRYVDLIVNPDVREVFLKRSRILAAVREYLTGRGFLEVETPVLQPLYGGASARPFSTHYNALDAEFYMRIAPELYLKRLLVGGFEGVFEIARNFRNEGMDRSHNPEFTMMELYVAYWDYEDMMRLTEELFRFTARAGAGSLQLEFAGLDIDLGPAFARVRYMQALADALGLGVAQLDVAALRAAAQRRGIQVEQGASRATLLDTLFAELVEPQLQQPTFVLDYPKETSPLAKDHRAHSGLVERFELFVAGVEFANAFSELNDPLEQRARFEAQVALRAGGDQEAQPLDEDYLRALEYGMPPASGLGVGIDRLVMLLTNSHSIRDVLLFPALRPEASPGHPDRPDDSGASAATKA